MTAQHTIALSCTVRCTRSDIYVPLPGRLTLTAFPNYIFVYARRQWFYCPLRRPIYVIYTPVALDRLIAEPDTAGYHKSLTESGATEHPSARPRWLGPNRRSTADLIRGLCCCFECVRNP